jgi:hypothetical protein
MNHTRLTRHTRKQLKCLVCFKKISEPYKKLFSESFEFSSVPQRNTGDAQANVKRFIASQNINGKPAYWYYFFVATSSGTGIIKAEAGV